MTAAPSTFVLRPGVIRRGFLEHAKVLSWLFLMVIVSGCVALGAKTCSQFIPRSVPDLPAVFSGSDPNGAAALGDVSVPIASRCPERPNKRKS